MALSPPSPARRAFAHHVRQADPRIDLARAALLIAAEEYPGLAVDTYLARLDTLADQVRELLARGATPSAAGHAADTIRALNAVLFEDHGFHGAEDDYYDPRNSFLNEVLDRKCGIPITISLVYMEVAARVGLTLAGIGTPGHFIVRYRAPSHGDAPDLFIDPYHGGALLSYNECAAHFRRLYGPDFTVSPEHLTPLTRHQILARLLRNLKHIYLRRRDYARAVLVVDRLLLVHPDALWELKDRGLLQYRLGAADAAKTDLLAYLEREPDAEDAQLLRYYVKLCDYLLTSRN